MAKHYNPHFMLRVSDGFDLLDAAKRDPTQTWVATPFGPMPMGTSMDIQTKQGVTNDWRYASYEFDIAGHHDIESRFPDWMAAMTGDLILICLRGLLGWARLVGFSYQLNYANTKNQNHQVHLRAQFEDLRQWASWTPVS
jgi:hypothetical protein